MLTDIQIMLSASPTWHWLIIIATVAAFTLLGAILEIMRQRHRCSKLRVQVDTSQKRVASKRS